MPEHELFQTYSRGSAVPGTVPSAIPGCEWAKPKRVGYDPATNTDTYRYTLHVRDRRAYEEYQKQSDWD
jgi:hypothetical protein